MASKAIHRHYRQATGSALIEALAHSLTAIKIDERELVAMRTAIETAGQAVDRLRDRLKVRAA